MALTNPYVIIRTQNAGVFAGNLAHHDGETVTLRNSRRLWYWDGAATLSQLATDGTSKPNTCKFPAPIEGDHILTQVIEIIEATDRARESITNVKVWTA